VGIVTPEEILAAQWLEEKASVAYPSVLRAIALTAIVLDDLHRDDDAELGAAVRRVLAVYRAGGPTEPTGHQRPARPVSQGRTSAGTLRYHCTVCHVTISTSVCIGGPADDPGPCCGAVHLWSVQVRPDGRACDDTDGLCTCETEGAPS
jgi:hypothetical protein